MKIYGQGPLSISQILSTYRRPAGVGSKENKGGSDRAEISAAARQLQELLRLSSEIPDVREDKVQELQAQIEAGTYKVNTEELAEALRRELRS
ncbi:MAG: flagellar biosynthesis anti-sigma factor FlgM [Moorellaceae bacterium]